MAYEDPQKRRERDRIRYKTNRQKYLLNCTRRRALKENIPFDVGDILIPGFCPVFGFPLVVGSGKDNGPEIPEIDKIISAKGYTKGNVWVISRRANRLKNDATPEESMRLAMVLYEKTRTSRPKLKEFSFSGVELRV
jgi:hypothetical protein